MKHRKYPCGPSEETGACPWLRSTPAGEFPASRFEQLRDTSTQPDYTTDPEAYVRAIQGGQRLFACHSGPPGGGPEDVVCSGWLLSGAAVAGNLTVRTALSSGALPGEAVTPDDRTPPLFPTYDEMARTQGDPTR